MQRPETADPGGAPSSGRATPGRADGWPPITVERTPTGYVLRDPLLVRLAGLDAVPLPFTALARPTTVLAHLRRLYPARTVRYVEPTVTPAAPQP